MSTNRLGELILAACNRKAARLGLKKYSLRQLAADARTVQPYLTRIIHGKAHPSREMLTRICRTLETTKQEMDEIFNETDYRTPANGELEEQEASPAA